MVLMDVVQQEHAATQAGQNLLRSGAVKLRAPTGRSAFEAFKDAGFVAVGLQPPDEPGPDVAGPKLRIRLSASAALAHDKGSAKDADGCRLHRRRRPQAGGGAPSTWISGAAIAVRVFNQRDRRRREGDLLHVDLAANDVHEAVTEPEVLAVPWAAPPARNCNTSPAA
jgi:hypothetical protein